MYKGVFSVSNDNEGVVKTARLDDNKIVFTLESQTLQFDLATNYEGDAYKTVNMAVSERNVEVNYGDNFYIDNNEFIANNDLCLDIVGKHFCN